MAVYGYTKLDAIVDIDQQLGDSADFTAIRPNGSVAQNRGGPQFRLHARQSRLSFETRTPTNYGQLQTFIQGDFFGTGGNQFISNSSTFRIRHAYGVLGPVLAGQTWSNFMDINDYPETLDFNGPAGQIFVRQAQIRYTHAFGKLSVSGAIENPQGDVTANTGATAAAPIPKAPTDPVNNIDRAPDLTLSTEYTDSWGHLMVAGVGRRFETDNGGGDATGLTKQSDSAWGGGVLFGGSLNIGALLPGLVPAILAKDTVGWNSFYGSGIGRYVLIGGGNFDSAVIKNFGTPAVREETQAQWGGFAWYQHRWTDELRSNFVYGIQRNHWSDAIASGFTSGTNTALADRTESVHVNLIWSPVKAVNLGLEYIWGERDLHRNPLNGYSPSGNANRVQVSAQYLF